MRIFVACILLILFSIPVHARESVLDIREVTSQAGLTAWLVEDHSVPVIALQFAFRSTGAVHDPAEKQGLAQLASNTMDEGAGELTSQEFQKELRDLSISLHFNSGRDHFGGAVKTLTKNRERAFELLRLALSAPRFDEEPVERMRSANRSRIRASLSDPDWIAARLLNDAAFAGHPYAQNSGGTLSTLGNITPQDLRAFAAALPRDRLAVAAAGDITPEELSLLLDEVFGALPETAEKPEVSDVALQNQGDIVIYKEDIPQTVIEMIQPGIPITDPDYQSAQVMNFILGSSGFGSRLMKEIRERRGLTYGVYSHLMNMEYFSGLGVSTSTQNANAAEMLRLIGAEWEKMKNVPVSEEELANAKSYLIGSLPLSLTSTDAIAGLLLGLQLDDRPIDYLDLREEKIRATSVEDVHRVAQRLLDAGKFLTILVGAPEGLEEDNENIRTTGTLPNVE